MSWDERRLGEFFRIKHGFAFKSQNYDSEGQHILLTPGNFHEEGGFRSRGEKEIYYTGSFPPSYALKKNDLLVVMTEQAEGLLGSSALVPSDDVFLHNQRLGLITELDEKELDRMFLYHLFNSSGIRKQISTGAGGTKVRHTSPDKILRAKFHRPSLPEQRKIAEILSTWESAIQTTERLVTTKLELKQGLMQLLLTGKKRFPSFSELGWKEVVLGELFTEIKDTNDGGDGHSIMTISSRLGLISQEDKFERVIAGESLNRYTQLKRNDFAYNKGNSKSYQMGCIYKLDDRESALVPFVYICFRPTEAVCSTFYQHWFLAHGLDRQLKKIITSGARGDGLLNVNTNDFFKLKVPLPPKEEQVAIGRMFQGLSREIELLQQTRGALRRQMRGLMQQLLTGKKRVNLERRALLS